MKNLVNLWWTSEKARFMRHPVLWSIAILVYVPASIALNCAIDRSIRRDMNKLVTLLPE